MAHQVAPGKNPKVCEIREPCEKDDGVPHKWPSVPRPKHKPVTAQMVASTLTGVSMPMVTFSMMALMALMAADGADGVMRDA